MCRRDRRHRACLLPTQCNEMRNLPRGSWRHETYELSELWAAHFAEASNARSYGTALADMRNLVIHLALQSGAKGTEREIEVYVDNVHVAEPQSPTLLCPDLEVSSDGDSATMNLWVDSDTIGMSRGSSAQDYTLVGSSADSPLLYITDTTPPKRGFVVLAFDPTTSLVPGAVDNAGGLFAGIDLVNLIVSDQVRLRQHGAGCAVEVVPSNVPHLLPS